MNKKAGVIMGVVIIAIALIIWWVAVSVIGVGEKPKSAVTKPPTKVENTTDKVVKPKVENSNNTGTSGNNNNSTNEESDTSTTDSGSFQLITESTLGEYTERDEIVVVANKKLLLIDGQVGSANDKQLQYVADTLTTNSDKISLFLNEGAYNSINIGSKLRVTYKVYVNDIGIEFPVVVDAQVIQ